MARHAAGGVGGVEEGEPQWLDGAPLVIPHVETSDVQLKGLPTKVEREPFHQQLMTRENHAAGVARFAVAWTTPDPFDAVVRQAPVLDHVPDVMPEGFLVHTVLGVRLAPYLMPEGEALDVHLNGLPTTAR